MKKTATPRRPSLERRGVVRIGRGVVWGRHCVVGGPRRASVIGDACVLGDSVKLEAGVHLGEGTRLGDAVCLGHASKAVTAGADPSAVSERILDLLIPEPTTEIGAGGLVRSQAVIYGHVRIGPHFATGHNALIREHTTIGARCVFGSFSGCDGYTLIGDDVVVGQGAYLAQSARIGNGVFIGPLTVLSDNPHILRTVSEDLQGPVIGDYVRIGIQCSILPGVRIGADALVGAASVVTRDVPPGVLALGSPCRVVRDLTPAEIEEHRSSVRRSAEAVTVREPRAGATTARRR